MHMTVGGKDMKLLSIENNVGLYLSESGKYNPEYKNDALQFRSLSVISRSASKLWRLPDTYHSICTQPAGRRI